MIVFCRINSCDIIQEDKTVSEKDSAGGKITWPIKV
ncbi:hypothetical protein CLOBOL_01464 [Enterocloster bolteae ATCC BAA-613]|uniref:Uncharacterized protein n=1 Tax=Enterocloster bolteae (strain ATCC BAA-613 / DSM 15670 / CCUG 46953 / JCM 12243 / WAL 16351) TaxID=411902 RepID=A8RL02_ENTBW|nr:hypothetical protein CLOBOL_01464 [Enterocloster bolteae ATCC BAA-613]